MPQSAWLSAGGGGGGGIQSLIGQCPNAEYMNVNGYSLIIITHSHRVHNTLERMVNDQNISSSSTRAVSASTSGPPTRAAPRMATTSSPEVEFSCPNHFKWLQHLLLTQIRAQSSRLPLPWQNHLLVHQEFLARCWKKVFIDFGFTIWWHPHWMKNANDRAHPHLHHRAPAPPFQNQNLR